MGALFSPEILQAGAVKGLMNGTTARGYRSVLYRMLHQFRSYEGGLCFNDLVNPLMNCVAACMYADLPGL